MFSLWIMFIRNKNRIRIIEEEKYQYLMLYISWILTPFVKLSGFLPLLMVDLFFLFFHLETFELFLFISEKCITALFPFINGSFLPLTTSLTFWHVKFNELMLNHV